MRWSKLKSLVEDRFADTVRGRVSINSARYGACTCGHAWLTIDGKLVANFCTRAYWNRYVVERDGHSLPEKQQTNFKGQPVDYGEMSRQDAYKSCWAFVHALTIKEALSDNDPLVQTLAVLDRRLGRRSLRAVDPESLHPLARKMFDFRIATFQGSHTIGRYGQHINTGNRR